MTSGGEAVFEQAFERMEDFVSKGFDVLMLPE